MTATDTLGTFSAPVLTLPLLAGLCLVPLVARARTAASAGRLAVGVSVGFLAWSAALVLHFLTAGDARRLVDPLHPADVPLLGVDGMASALLLLTTVVALAWTLVRQRSSPLPRELAALVATEVALIGQFLAAHLLVFGAFALWGALEVWEDRRAHVIRGLRRRVLMPATLAILAAGVLGLVAGVPDPLGVPRAGWSGASGEPGTVMWLLVTAAALVRLGVVPLAPWVPTALAHGRMELTGFASFIMPSGMLLYHVVCPELPAHPEVATGLGWLGALAALHAGLLAVVQTDLRRFVGVMSVAQGGLVLTGLSSRLAAGHAGGLTLWLGSAIALSGLGIAVDAVRNRFGSTRVGDLAGVGHKRPLMSFAVLVFGLMATGLPGTLDYVGSELVFEGALHIGLGPLVACVLAIGLLAVGLFRVWTFAFVGAAGPRATSVAPDLVPSERGALSALGVLMVVLGVAPAGVFLLEQGAPGLEAELRQEHHPDHLPATDSPPAASPTR
jgi:NADH-quinone oxidoreductase subunit M